ncbi:MAG TPA: SDR family oxidoreductase [Sphingomicrobium sp.]|nr:SDR family oxidoreductase [Sphingomicrobium sp.]
MKKVALVTGASAGLGVEFARQLSSRGYSLVLAARRKDRLDELASELGNARPVAIDLSKSTSADNLMADLEDNGETVDLLVNNAGFGLIGSFAELDSRRERQMIDLNVGTLSDLCRGVAPAMIERGSGGIINVASIAAFQPGPKMAVYFATKAFVLSLTEALHEELKPHGVKVSCLCPGPTRTEFGDVAGFGGNAVFDRIAMNAKDVVESGLKGLEANHAVVIPGWMNKVTAASTRFAPRFVVRKVTGAIRY